MTYRRAQVLFVTIIVTLSLIADLSPVRAVETYSLTVSPSRTQEANLPGVNLTLSVGGATVSQVYTFEWVVLDPSNNGKNTIKSTVAGQSSFVLSALYPQDFGGSATISYVGTYGVNVAQTTPVINSSVASRQFNAGLTDQTTYQRTSVVSTKATGYSPSENVTVDITRGGFPAPSFPRFILTNSNGDLSTTWLTDPSTLTGDYTVTLTGDTTPPKSPPDSQAFTLQTAPLSVNITVPNVTLGSGDLLTISARVTYPDGTLLTQGVVTTALSAASRPVGGPLSLGYDPNQARWVGNYTISENDPSGIWVVEVSASDPYANSGVHSASITANITLNPQQNPLISFWFLGVLGAVATGAFLGILLLKKKRIVRHQLMVDLQAVGREADRVKNQEFFRSVQRQLSHMREGPEEKNDG